MTRGEPPSQRREAELLAAHALLGNSRQQFEDAIVAARRDGLSWERIGAVFGIRKQTAWERWRHLDARLDVADDAPPPREQGGVA